MRTKLSAEKARELTTDKDNEILWDSEIAGLGLRVTRSGIKTFVFKYRNKGGVIRKPKLGRWPGLTVPAARTEALRIMSDIAKGGDPSAEKKAVRKGMTLSEFFEKEYWPRYVEPYKKQSSAQGDRWNFKNHLQPALGKKRLDLIKPSDVQRLHSSMREHPYSANRVLALLSGIFSKAQAWGFYDQANPTKHIKGFREKSRVRYLSPDEFKRLYEAITRAREYSLYSDSAIGAIEFLLWTGCRRGEAMNLRWEFIDFDRCRALLPDSKTGAKELTLSPGAVSVLDRMPRTSEYIFPGTVPGEPIKELRKTWEGIKRDAVSRMDCPYCDDDRQSGMINREGINGLPFEDWRYHCEACGFSGDARDAIARHTGQDRQDVGQDAGKDFEALVSALRAAGAKVPVMADLRMHDLRHAFATVAVSLQAGLPIIGELLGHRESKTTAKYAHVMDDAKRAVSVAVYERMKEMMEPDTGAAKIETVALHDGDKQDSKAQGGGA